jgi:hypothetical protein
MKLLLLVVSLLAAGCEGPPAHHHPRVWSRWDAAQTPTWEDQVRKTCARAAALWAEMYEEKSSDSIDHRVRMCILAHAERMLQAQP